MTIGELSIRSGLRPSALRYYERVGLIPAPIRRSGRRDYASDALSHLEVIQCARACGFTLSEIRQLVRGFNAPESPRWRTLAESKIKEMEQRIAQAREMTRLLQRIKRCQCGTIEECGQRLRARPTRGLPVSRTR
jgi:MerR family redox-sensitive transcriptional activator SoxR